MKYDKRLGLLLRGQEILSDEALVAMKIMDDLREAQAEAVFWQNETMCLLEED